MTLRCLTQMLRMHDRLRWIVRISMRHPSLGQCLSADNLRELIKFAYDEKIVLMADEVYQVGLGL